MSDTTWGSEGCKAMYGKRSRRVFELAILPLSASGSVQRASSSRVEIPSFSASWRGSNQKRSVATIRVFALLACTHPCGKRGSARVYSLLESDQFTMSGCCRRLCLPSGWAFSNSIFKFRRERSNTYRSL